MVSRLKRFGAGIDRDALWEYVTMIVDPLSFLFKRWINKDRLSCHDSELSNEVHYAT